MDERQTRIVAISAPSVPLWAVFTNEEDEPEIWTERVHLWAHIRTGLRQDDKDTAEFLGNEVPSDEFKVEAMVLAVFSSIMVHPSKREATQCGYKHAAPASWRNGANKNGSRELRWLTGPIRRPAVCSSRATP